MKGMTSRAPFLHKFKPLTTSEVVYAYTRIALRISSEKTADHIARSCLAVRVRMLNHVLPNLYDEALRPLGLKVSQLNIFVVAAKLGLARPAEVCDLLLLDPSTLSRNVQRMQAHGWLEVVPDPNRRAQPFRITASGRALLKRATPFWEQAQQQAADLLGDEGVRVLSQIEKQFWPWASACRRERAVLKLGQGSSTRPASAVPPHGSGRSPARSLAEAQRIRRADRS